MNKESSSSVVVAMNDMVPKDKLYALVSSAQVFMHVVYCCTGEIEVVDGG